MAMVLSILRTSFVAVPALSRVEPVTISGPVGRSMATSTGTRRTRRGLQERRIVPAPVLRAAVSAPRT